MSLLEDRYRYVLRLLPAPYRAEREEEMVSAFLEGAGDPSDAQSPRPRWSEVASVAALSVRVRLGGAGAAPRPSAWGRAVRLVAVLGLFYHAMMGCVWFAGFVETYGLFGAPFPDYQTRLAPAGSPERLWDIALGFAGLPWLAAFVALVRGRPRAAKILVSFALVAHFGFALELVRAVPEEALLITLQRGVLAALPALALAAGFHRDAPRTRHPLWVAALPAGAGALVHVILGLLATRSPQTPAWSWIWPWFDETGLACLALLLATAWAVTRPRPGDGPAPVLPLALAVLVVPVALGRLLRLNLRAADPMSQVMTAVNVGQLVALLLCGVSLAVLGARTLPARTTLASRQD
ncbi:hypothetical protein [Sphaerisporangium sp. TRM90804]|uniref:hypothetical protein n=1 Tax=Sphaerisporangium sp. TRM90804 TaxID=3031113 RepID=UPI00244C4878|nr:hypothetical protein [Sphaerisporangium sp. TRM90804]MDH2426564.1 hypothetical protein [Sphaerisporangium sp. TRM90804]